MTLVVHAHQPYVQRVAVGGFFAVCPSCSWMGPDRPTEPQAEADGAAHAATTGWAWDDDAKRLVRRGQRS